MFYLPVLLLTVFAFLPQISGSVVPAEGCRENPPIRFQYWTISEREIGVRFVATSSAEFPNDITAVIFEPLDNAEVEQITTTARIVWLDNTRPMTVFAGAKDRCGQVSLVITEEFFFTTPLN